MKPWRGLVLGTLTAFLLSAPAADAVAATTASAAAAATDERAARDAARAAKAAERAERQAARAAAKAERQRAIADAKAARAQEKAAPTAAPVHVAGVNAAAGDASADLVGNTAAHTETAESAAPTAESAAAAPLSDKEAARLDRRQMRAERKAERAAGKEERTATLAAAKAEKRAAAIAEREAKMAARAEKIAAHKRDRGSRYRTLLTDNGFTYYLDVQNTRWIPRPYSSSEYMIDAWVRLVENTTGEPVAEDGKIRPAKYFLEHYYISPERRQVMFLSELEVTGRPDNAVKERAYDPKNWEQLVPGSIEDELYAAITARMKSAPGQRGGILSGTSGMSLRDMIEEYARISF